MAREVCASRPLNRMLADEYPVPVTLIHDEVRFGAAVLVHRPVAVAHDASEQCPCNPLRFTSEEMQTLTCEELNGLLHNGIQ